MAVSNQSHLKKKNKTNHVICHDRFHIILAGNRRKYECLRFDASRPYQESILIYNLQKRFQNINIKRRFYTVSHVLYQESILIYRICD